MCNLIITIGLWLCMIMLFLLPLFGVMFSGKRNEKPDNEKNKGDIK